MTNDAGIIVAREGVISIGFFGGLWIYLGVDPEFLLIQTFAKALSQMNPESGGGIIAIYYLISVAALVMSLLLVYILGGIVGIVAVILGFVGGIFIGSFGWIFLIIGYVLGLFSPDINQNYVY
jgi:hypothetical protein